LSTLLEGDKESPCTYFIQNGLESVVEFYLV